VPAGVVASIWIKRFKRGPMDRVLTAEMVAGRGLRGNANQGGRRQVTLIDEAAWNAAKEQLGADVPPEARRANIMLRGIDLERTNGRVLQIGNCRVRIYGETRPCEKMDEAHRGLRDALRPNWRAGAFAEVLDDGFVSVGDPVKWIPNE
jgi:MOSC domain-containing protein YiiM